MVVEGEGAVVSWQGVPVRLVRSWWRRYVVVVVVEVVALVAATASSVRR